MDRLVQVALLAVAGFALVPAAGGQSAVDDHIQKQLEAMQEQIERLGRDNTLMRDEIDDLHAQLGENWLAERRADEIRSLVADVLADADVRVSRIDDGLTAGWSDHFFMASPDNRFRLEVDGLLQFRWIYNYHDQPDKHVQGFENTRTQLTLRGHVFGPEMTYLLRTDATRNEPGLVTGLFFTRDAWIRYRFNNEWSVRAGQFKLPFNREELVSSAYQLAVERSLVNEAMNLGRSQGVEVVYATDHKKYSVAFSDGQADSLNFFNTGVNPVNTTALTADLAEWAVTGRFEHLLRGSWEQFVDFTSPPGDEFGLLVGLGIHAQRYESGTSNARDRPSFAWTVDVSAEWGGATLFGSFIHHYVDDPFFLLNAYGIVVQGGVYFTPKLELFARVEYSWLDYNTDFASFFDRSSLTLLTLGANYYIDGHDLKWSTDIGFGLSQIEDVFSTNPPSIAGYRTDADGVKPQIVFRSQFQLLF